MFWIAIFGVNGLAGNLVERLVFDPVPENAGYFLTGAVTADRDDAGNLYLLDPEAKVIFRWSADGSFKGIIGRPGQGPGEFSFMTRVGAQAYLATVGEVLYVFDGGQRKIQKFDLAGKYLASDHTKMANGRTEGFFVTNSHHFYVLNYNFLNDPGSYNLIKTNSLNSPGEVIFAADEKEIGRPALESRGDTYFIEAFYPQVAASHCRERARLVMGASNKPEFQVVNTATGKRRTVAFDYPRLEVTDADREEFQSQEWLKWSPGAKVVFPDKHSYYDRLIPMAGGGFLAYHISPVHSRIRGVVLDESGKVLKRFTDVCGQGGNLLNANGRIIRVKVLEDGRFEISQLAAL